MKNLFRLATVVIIAIAAFTVEGAFAANQTPLEVVQMYLDTKQGITRPLSSFGLSQDRATRSGLNIRASLSASMLLSYGEPCRRFDELRYPAGSEFANVGDDARYKMLFIANRQGAALQQWYYTKHEGEYYWL